MRLFLSFNLSQSLLPHISLSFSNFLSSIAPLPCSFSSEFSRFLSFFHSAARPFPASHLLHPPDLYSLSPLLRSIPLSSVFLLNFPFSPYLVSSLVSSFFHFIFRTLPTLFLSSFFITSPYLCLSLSLSVSLSLSLSLSLFIFVFDFSFRLLIFRFRLLSPVSYVSSHSFSLSLHLPRNLFFFRRCSLARVVFLSFFVILKIHLTHILSLSHRLILSIFRRSFSRFLLQSLSPVLL